jgi:hypothetical protein
MYRPYWSKHGSDWSIGDRHDRRHWSHWTHGCYRYHRIYWENGINWCQRIDWIHGSVGINWTQRIDWIHGIHGHNRHNGTVGVDGTYRITGLDWIDWTYRPDGSDGTAGCSGSNWNYWRDRYHGVDGRNGGSRVGGADRSTWSDGADGADGIPRRAGTPRTKRSHWMDRIHWANRTKQGDCWTLHYRYHTRRGYDGIQELSIQYVYPDIRHNDYARLVLFKCIKRISRRTFVAFQCWELAAQYRCCCEYAVVYDTYGLLLLSVSNRWCTRFLFHRTFAESQVLAAFLVFRVQAVQRVIRDSRVFGASTQDLDPLGPPERWDRREALGSQDPPDLVCRVGVVTPDPPGPLR